MSKYKIDYVYNEILKCIKVKNVNMCLVCERMTADTSEELFNFILKCEKEFTTPEYFWNSEGPLWDYDGLSENPMITWEIVKSTKNTRPWNLTSLSNNKNIALAIKSFGLKEILETFEHSKCIKGEWNFHNLTYNLEKVVNFDSKEENLWLINLMLNHKEFDWDWNVICCNKYLTFEIVTSNPDIEWSYSKLTLNKNIKLKNILENLDKNWNFEDLCEGSYLVMEAVMSDLNSEESKNLRKLIELTKNKVDWTKMIWNEYLIEYMQGDNPSFDFLLKKFPWNYEFISSRRYLSLDFVKRTTDPETSMCQEYSDDEEYSDELFNEMLNCKYDDFDACFELKYIPWSWTELSYNPDLAPFDED